MSMVARQAVTLFRIALAQVYAYNNIDNGKYAGCFHSTSIPAP
jgi:hypothetical protein